MFYVSAAMQKSGSAWYYLMTNAVLSRSGYADALPFCRRHQLAPANTNCNIGRLSQRKLLRCLILSARGNTFVVKTHAAPTRTFRWLVRLKLSRATYLYRDPRDAALSVFEAGQRARRNNWLQSPFRHYDTLEATIHFVAAQLQYWEAWHECPDVFITRYEDLLENPVMVLSGLCAAWNVPARVATIQDVVAYYSADRATSPTMAKQLHLNVAKVGRYRTEMNDNQLSLCNELFRPYLTQMGYAL
jgi:hypothetical protein